MIKSMTGFAALTREDDFATIAVTIRAVNHRHLDLQLRSPQSLSSIEGELRALVARHVARARGAQRVVAVPADTRRRRRVQRRLCAGAGGRARQSARARAGRRGAYAR